MERLLTLYSEVQSTDVRWLWYDAEKNAVVISLEENEFENERQSKIGLSL